MGRKATKKTLRPPDDDSWSNIDEEQVIAATPEIHRSPRKCVVKKTTVPSKKKKMVTVSKTVVSDTDNSGSGGVSPPHDLPQPTKAVKAKKEPVRLIVNRKILY